MASWEDEEDFSAVVAAVATATGGAAAWDDEEDVGGVKEAWDDDSEEETDTSRPVSATTATTKKKTLKEKIAEREAQRVSKIEEMRIAQEETEQQRKLREQQAVIEADLDNAKDLFAGVEGASQPPAPLSTQSSVLDVLPKGKDDFLPYSELISNKVLELGQSPHYHIVVENIIKRILQPCSAEVCRRVDSAVNTIISEKQRAAKDAQKKKKNGVKKSVKMGAGDDLKAYDNVYDDYEDFM